MSRRVIYPLCNCQLDSEWAKSAPFWCSCGGWGRKAIWNDNGEAAPAPTVLEFHKPVLRMARALAARKRL